MPIPSLTLASLNLNDLNTTLVAIENLTLDDIPGTAAQAHAAAVVTAGVSALQVAAGNGETILTAGLTLARYTANGAARTGLILQAGTVAGQAIAVTNEDTTTINSITFDVAATSHVAGGTTAIINGNQARSFVWNGALWYEEL